MYPDVRYAIQYYQALDNCQIGACPDVIPNYGGVFGGLIIISIGIVIFVFAQMKARQGIVVKDKNG